MKKSNIQKNITDIVKIRKRIPLGIQKKVSLCIQKRFRNIVSPIKMDVVLETKPIRLTIKYLMIYGKYSNISSIESTFSNLK